jgi:hypothetical protein
MRRLLTSLGFSIGADLDDLMGLLQAAQQFRFSGKKTTIVEVTRTTALAVLLHLSPRLRESLASFGFQYEQYLHSIGLVLPIKYGPVNEVDIYFSFQEALVHYAKSDDAVLVASADVFAVAILEDGVDGQHGDFELEGRLANSGLETKRLAQALRSRTLPFDPRRRIGKEQVPRFASAHRGSARPPEALSSHQSISRPSASGTAETLPELDDLQATAKIAKAPAAGRQTPDPPRRPRLRPRGAAMRRLMSRWNRPAMRCAPRRHSTRIIQPGGIC